MADEQIINIFKALADPTRLSIVRQLMKRVSGSPCSQVRACSNLSQPTMSHHLSKLVEAGVVIEHKTGKEKIYSLNNELLAAHGLNPSYLLD